jgi:hypothetical protein
MTRYAAPRRHTLAWLVGAVVPLLLLTGCAELSAAATTRSALEDAGYRAVRVDVRTNNGTTTVDASWASTTSGTEAAAPEIDRAVGVIWSRCPVEIDALVATARIDGTSTATATTRTFERAQLTAMLGQQPDVDSSLGPSRDTLLRWTAGGFGVSLAVTALLLWFLRRRADRRRAAGAPPAWRGVPGYAPPAATPPPGWPGPAGPQPNPGTPPPGWSGPRPDAGTPPPGWFTPQRGAVPAQGAAAHGGPGAPAVPPPPPAPPAPEPTYDIWERLPS